MRSEVSKRILSETSDERKQKVRESTNELLKTMSKEAKDKAEELIDKMHGFTKDDCILNALTCVDEILNQFTWKPSNGSSFWQEVKQEILNRQ